MTSCIHLLQRQRIKVLSPLLEFDLCRLLNRSSKFDQVTSEILKMGIRGKQFRLRGKGMPILRSNNQGDLYIQVVTETPQKLSRRQRELLQEFEKLSSEENSPESTGFFSKMKNFLDGLGEQK